MVLIPWSEDMSVDIKEIDAQHKKLVEYLNELHTAMDAGKNWSVLSPTLEKMEEYTKIHFITEEKYFEQFHYVDAVSHKNAHQSFIDKVFEFKKIKKEEGSFTLSFEILYFLEDWLFGHIKGADREYIKCFKEHGLA